MKTVTFPAYCTFGKGDSGESEVDVELTDEEYERVMALGTDADIYYDGFSECEELKDIYDKVYQIAVAQMTEEMRDYGEAEIIESLGANDPNWKIDDTFHCGVNFPFGFEDMIEDDEDEKNL